MLNHIDCMNVVFSLYARDSFDYLKLYFCKSYYSFNMTSVKPTLFSTIKKLIEFEVRKEECRNLLETANDKLAENCGQCGKRLLSCDDDETWDEIEELESEISDINSSIASLWEELAGFDSKST